MLKAVMDFTNGKWYELRSGVWATPDNWSGFGGMGGKFIHQDGTSAYYATQNFKGDVRGCDGTFPYEYDAPPPKVEQVYTVESDVSMQHVDNPLYKGKCREIDKREIEPIDDNVCRRDTFGCLEPVVLKNDKAIRNCIIFLSLVFIAIVLWVGFICWLVSRS